ncbi:hypothetical protein BU17DRAFT_14931, partial [Hysterangium stoloniferum]
QIEFPTITDEIQDRSKGGRSIKRPYHRLTTWFIIQCIAKKAKRRHTTQIELLTVALASLNVIMYFLWWNKPLNIRCSVPVHIR